MLDQRTDHCAPISRCVSLGSTQGKVHCKSPLFARKAERSARIIDLLCELRDHIELPGCANPHHVRSPRVWKCAEPGNRQRKGWGADARIGDRVLERGQSVRVNIAKKFQSDVNTLRRNPAYELRGAILFETFLNLAKRAANCIVQFNRDKRADLFSHAHIERQLSAKVNRLTQNRRSWYNADKCSVRANRFSARTQEGSMGLSDRQRKIYEFITKFMRDKGRPPTIREIGSHVGISSTSVVNYNLNILVREGLIQREKEVSRGLRVVGGQVKTLAGDSIYAVQIPLLGTIAAGSPIPIPESGLEPLDTLMLTRDLIPDSEGMFALKVKGNSMIDALINDGDVVVMKKQETAQNGEMCAVWLKDRNETTLKRIYKEKNRIKLQPMNPTMKAFYEDARNVQIQGKVVLVVRQLQKTPA